MAHTFTPILKRQNYRAECSFEIPAWALQSGGFLLFLWLTLIVNLITAAAKAEPTSDLGIFFLRFSVIILDDELRRLRRLRRRRRLVAHQTRGPFAQD